MKYYLGLQLKYDYLKVRTKKEVGRFANTYPENPIKIILTTFLFFFFNLSYWGLKVKGLIIDQSND